jgi:hypothetical protein
MSQFGLAQPAVNFTCNDCFGINHDLFTELDAGKVIVLCWVEPCGGCVDASLISSYLVESFQENYPDKVYLYLADDYANTDCVSLISWANMFGIHPTTFFSDTSVNMLGYCEPGMPKVVVVAGDEHVVYYNANNTIDATTLEEAIQNAINATTTVINESLNNFSSIYHYPNPSDNKVLVSLNLVANGNIKAEIIDLSGRIFFTKSWSGLSEGLNNLQLNVTPIETGIYILKLIDGLSNIQIKMVIAH